MEPACIDLQNTRLVAQRYPEGARHIGRDEAVTVGQCDAFVQHVFDIDLHLNIAQRNRCPRIQPGICRQFVFVDGGLLLA
jgi:hypothetical protein